MFTYPISAKALKVKLKRRRRLSLGVALTSLGIALSICSAAPAGAALISTGACDETSTSQPFLSWGDTNRYELVPGGDFEGSLSGWTLSDAAQRVPGSEPFGASGSVGAYALALPTGASAQSPFVCVNASYPTFRFFARNQSLTATMLVQVVYKTVLGTVALPLGVVAASGTWQPTLPMLTGSVAVAALTGGTAQVALRFTALSGSSELDDVFVDPRMK